MEPPGIGFPQKQFPVDGACSQRLPALVIGNRTRTRARTLVIAEVASGTVCITALDERSGHRSNSLGLFTNRDFPSWACSPSTSSHGTSPLSTGTACVCVSSAQGTCPAHDPEEARDRRVQHRSRKSMRASRRAFCARSRHVSGAGTSAQATQGLLSEETAL